MHEIGHAFGFDAATPGFSTFVDSDANGLVYHADGQPVRLDRGGSELDPAQHTAAIMSETLEPRVRKSLTEIDLLPIARVWNQPLEMRADQSVETLEIELSAVGGGEPEFVSLPILNATANQTGLANGSFTQSDPSAEDFGWETVGDVQVGSGVATISEDVGMVSDLSQTFVVPSGINTISFTLTGISMDVGSVSDANSIHPPEAFEVALMNPNDATAWMGELLGLSGGDALLSLQADGSVHFADGVTVNGSSETGRVIDFNEPIDVLIRLPEDSSGEDATLMFDLIGFGEDNSQVQVSDLVLQAANGWQNPIDRFEVSGNGELSPVDGLAVINELARVTVHDPETNELAEITDEVGPPPFYDVNGDGLITPLDALGVINEISRRQSMEAEQVDDAIGALIEEFGG